MEALVARIVAAGAASAIFVYFSVKLLVKPWLDNQHADAWWRDLATNGFAVLLGQLAAFGLMFVMVGLATSELIVETIFVGIIAAAVATFGHEAITNYGQRGQE